MSLEEAFLADVIAHPDDDAPRLVFADWLEDNGQADRGEFIRRHIELERMDQADPRYSELEARCRRLRARFLDRVPEDLYFRRGMAEGFGWVSTCAGYTKNLFGDKFVKEGPGTFARHPIREVDLFLSRDEVEQVAAAPHLARLRTLWVSVSSHPRNDPPNDLTILRPLLESPRLTGLRRLAVNGGPVADQILPLFKDLSATAAFRPLDGLVLTSRCRLRDEDLASLAQSPLTNQLTRLGFNTSNEGINIHSRHFRPGHEFTVDGAAAFVRSPLWTVLTHLRWEGDGSSDPGPAQKMVSALGSGRIRWLGLPKFGSSESAAVIASLVGASSWGPLESLHLSGMTLNGEPLRTLLGCTRLEQLRDLNLSVANLDDADLEELARCPYLGRLLTLDLGCNKFSDGGFCRFILAANSLRPVHLYLGATDVAGPGLRVLGGSLFAERLRSLCLPNDGELDVPDDSVLDALAEATALPHLTTLMLGECPCVTAEALARLIRSTHLPHLSALDAYGWLGQEEAYDVLLSAVESRGEFVLSTKPHESRHNPYDNHYDLPEAPFFAIGMLQVGTPFGCPDLYNLLAD